jgi:hypothetical protein
MKMKNLLEIIFKKGPPPDFMDNKYQSGRVNAQRARASANNSEYDLEEPEDVDEMQIDKIYQSL